MNLREECQKSIRAGLDFLRRSQLPSGEFITLVGPEPNLILGAQHDPSIFTTVNVATSLVDMDDPVARFIVGRAADFLLLEMLPGGLWRFWTKAHPGSRGMPPDVDDTVCVSAFLKRLGRVFPDPRRMLLANRSRDGRFFTWITPRARHLAFAEGRAFLAGALASRRARAVYFKSGPVPPQHGDVDSVVNANVVVALGDTQGGERAGAWVARVLERNEADRSDRWYQSHSALLYAVSRGREQGIGAFKHLEPVIAEKVQRLHPSCPSALELGQLACALLAIDRHSPCLDSLIQKILSAQSGNGDWSARVYYYDSYKRALCWGSRELTTGFCLEALARYSKY